MWLQNWQGNFFFCFVCSQVFSVCFSYGAWSGCASPAGLGSFFRFFFLSRFPLHLRFGKKTPRGRSHLDVLLHAELRQGLLDAQGGESGCSVGVPALPHDLPHDAQRLHGNDTAELEFSKKEQLMQDDCCCLDLC